jgi:hypothetical protein
MITSENDLPTPISRSEARQLLHAELLKSWEGLGSRIHYVGSSELPDVSLTSYNDIWIIRTPEVHYINGYEKETVRTYKSYINLAGTWALLGAVTDEEMQQLQIFERTEFKT